MAGASFWGLAAISACWFFAGSSAQPAGLIASDRYWAAADTDSVATDDDLLLLRRTLARADTLPADSMRTDSTLTDTVAADTLRPLPFIPLFRGDRRSASLFPRSRRPLSSRISPIWKHRIELDSTENKYVARETVGRSEVRYPVVLGRDEYRRARGLRGMRENWAALVQQRERQRQQRRRGGLGFNIVVPGGRQSAFTTIFGKPEVDLRVNGQADIRAGFDYRKSDQQVSVTGKAAQLDPDFKQDLRLGITGSIGDKMRVDVNYDTNNQFDFQNQLKLQYTGYEDEIIQSIEAGNVFLQTPSTLIRGGQSLFGIKSQFQLGGLHLTTVMSQQEGQSNSLSIDGGSESNTFDLKPTDYDEGKHFYLGYYFRNRWEDALADPPNLRVAHGFTRINEIEVWKFELTSPEDENVREVVGMVDLGESEELLTLADRFVRANADDLPRNARDRYSDVDIETLREPATLPNSFLRDEKGLSDNDFQTGRFRKLEPGRDYVVDDVLGYISLNQRLQDNEALTVAYRYIAGSQVFQVGDFSSDGFAADQRLVQKLLRPNQPRQPNLNAVPPFNPAAWYLELRNIYPIGGRGVNPNDFKLDIEFQPPGKTAQTKLPGVGEPQTVIQLLGLDRLNEDGAQRPDNLFDYLPGYTIESSKGLLIFPYLEPFGARIDTLIGLSNAPESERSQLRQLYVFNRLYTEKKQNARLDTQLDVYRIRGSYKGAAQDFYDLRAYAGLVQGSVRVTSAGTELRENVDFVVDYQSGTVTITNPTFLTKDVEISYEQNSFFNLQKKTLLGARADYDLDERLALGATVMRLSQKSPIDKFRIGEEPISNTIWGVDGALNLEPRWLTRFIDAIPFINTKAASSISVTGEFAQLRPGHTETAAFDRTRRELQNEGQDFKPDELQGISYVDDFEGFENTYSLAQPGTWQMAAAPDSVGAVDRFGLQTGPVSDSLRTNWRGSFAWYRVNQNIISELSGSSTVRPDAVRVVLIEEVFPNRDIRGEIDRTQATLDMYFNPSERGPYNYTTELRNFLDNPRDAWGGMVQRLPEGFNDFSLKNIEFVEFIMQAYPENLSNDAGPDAKLYVDLGFVSEDVLPNERLNDEDGLSVATIGETSISSWGRVPVVAPDRVIKVDAETRRTEDVGIDGLASYGGDYPAFATEQGHFTNFLNSLDRSETDPRYLAEIARAEVDPSGDDYHFYGNNRYFEDPRFYPPSIYPGGATFQQRMSRYFAGQELNSFEGQTELAENTSVRRGNSRYPDSEDINLNSTVDTENSYFQYELPLSKAALDSLSRPDRVDDFVVGQITDGETGRETGWYQIRIPIRKFKRRVGSIQDFSKIESMRIWTTGHQVPITLRFATLELVGSQWQKSEQIKLERELPGEEDLRDTRLSISSVNNEENADVYQSPLGTVVSLTRLASGGTQNAREQAMVLRAENLYPGRQRGIFKTFSQGLDFLKYSNVRMFAHFHGDLGDGRKLADLPVEEGRSKASLFLRLGANETNDYYEYEQPLTPSSELSRNSSVLWQTNQDFNGQTLDLNSMNIDLAALNQLKVTRDQRGVPTDSVFWVGAESFAPPGTRIAIRGTPSLSRINTIAIGIRNPADTASVDAGDVLADVTMWINELRVSGYDEKAGWSALANASIQLADLGRVRANIQTQTDGFGSLASSLGEREQQAISNWSVTTEVNADKPIPERYGWKIPISYQVQSNTSTPRFAPSRGDVRLREILAQIDERVTSGEISQEQGQAEKEEARLSAETHSESRSFTGRISKSGSKSGILRYTLDGISASYSHTDSKARNPSLALNNSWRWSSTLTYRMSIRKPRTVRPFWFLDDVPLIGVLGGLRFNYLPQSLNTSATTSRNFSQTKERPRVLGTEPRNATELLVDNPFRDKHTFNHTRNFGIQYNPFQFLNLSFDVDTGLSLNAAGVDTLSIVADTALDTVYTAPDGKFTIEDYLQLPGADPDAVGTTVFELNQLKVLKTQEVIGKLFTKGQGVRAERHGQRFSATFRPRLTSKALDWLNIQDVVYSVQYSWQNGSLGRNTGASVSNRVDIRTGLSLRIQDLWRKFGFYKKLEEAQRKAESEKAARKRQREQDRARRKAEEERRREAEELRKSLEADAEQPESPDDEAAAAEEPAKPEPGQPTEDTVQDEEDEGGRRFPIPLPNPVSLLRRTALALTGIRDFSVTYTGTRGSRSTNVGDPQTGESAYGLIDAFKGRGPSLGYRFGFSRDIPVEERISDPTLQVTDVIENSDQFQGRTSLNPSKALSINLTWSLNQTENTTRTYSQENLVGVPATQNRTGTSRASIWAFGASYLDLLQSQLDIYRADLDAAIAGGTGTTVIGDESGDGQVILTNKSVVAGFKDAFTTSFGSIGGQNIPLPLPGWNVNYTGFGNWPIINKLVQSATVRHGYTADYSSDFRTNSLAAAVAPNDTSLVFAFVPGTSISYVVPRTEVGAVRINQRYQPFIGVDLNWKGRIQTNIAWNKSTSYSLSTSNYEISESSTNELTISANFQKVGMRIPLFGKKLNNRVSIGLSVSRSVTLDQRFLMQKALTTAVSSGPDYNLSDALSGDLVSVITSHTRLSMSPQISYQFSNRVTANFTLRYEKLNSEISRQPSSTNMTGTFNVRVNITN